MGNLIVQRYRIVTCDYCGREHRFNGSTKPTEQQLKEAGLIVLGPNRHFCSEDCAADRNHEIAINRAGNLKQFQPGKKFERI